MGHDDAVLVDVLHAVAGPRTLQVARTASRGLPQELDQLALEAARYLLAHGGDKMLEESNIQYQP